MKFKSPYISSLFFLRKDGTSEGLDMKRGLNVICGASDTGKSFFVESIDFATGGGKALRDIKERIDFERLQLAITKDKSTELLFGRSVQGGDFSLTRGSNEDPSIKITEALKATHGAGDLTTLSAFLLNLFGFSDHRVRKNAQGVTRNLTFRDLARLLIIQEEEIIKAGSPFLSGQYVNRTAETSVLKFLLTSIDDGALISAQSKAAATDNNVAKIELIDEWIRELQGGDGNSLPSKASLAQQLEAVNKSILNHQESLVTQRKNLDEKATERQTVFGERRELQKRVDELSEMLGRFELLDSHYASDMQRLVSIEESGSMLLYQQKVTCPVCGALPEHQHEEGDLGDQATARIINAASAEIHKIRRLAAELKGTKEELQAERDNLNRSIQVADSRLREVDAEVRNIIAPTVGNSETELIFFMDLRGTIARNLEKHDRLDRLEKQKRELAITKSTVDEASEETLGESQTSKSIYEEFSEVVRKLLKSWDFPDTKAIHFDEAAMDFVIQGKPRGSYGKGLRAITHAAATLGLMEFCIKKGYPHPGFVVLDSPLLAYYKPEGAADSLKGTNVKERFYEAVASRFKDQQVIVVENEHPPRDLLKKINFVDFTKNPKVGRYGFFPPRA